MSYCKFHTSEYTNICHEEHAIDNVSSRERPVCSSIDSVIPEPWRAPYGNEIDWLILRYESRVKSLSDQTQDA